jgi:hypothetical protein
METVFVPHSANLLLGSQPTCTSLPLSSTGTDPGHFFFFSPYTAPPFCAYLIDISEESCGSDDRADDRL